MQKAMRVCIDGTRLAVASHAAGFEVYSCRPARAPARPITLLQLHALSPDCGSSAKGSAVIRAANSQSGGRKEGRAALAGDRLHVGHRQEPRADTEKLELVMRPFCSQHLTDLPVRLRALRVHRPGM